MGCKFNLEGLAVAQRGQLDRPAIVLLQKGQHGIDGVERQPIDGENLIAGLQAGFRCRHSGFDLADADGILLHPGHKTDGVKIEIVRPVRIGNRQLGADRLPIALDVNRNRLPHVHRGADRHLLPGRIVDIIEAGNQVARLESGGGGGRVIGNEVDVGRLRAKSFHLVVHHVKAGHEQQREQEVRHRTRQADENTLPARMGVELGRVAGRRFARRFARHLDVAAERQQAQPVIGVTAAKAEQTFAETYGEDFHPHAAQLGDGEVAKLVHQYHDAEHNKHGNCAG